MARRATWIVLIALLLAPILGGTAPVFAQDSTGDETATTVEAPPAEESEATPEETAADPIETPTEEPTPTAATTPTEEATATEDVTPTGEPAPAEETATTEPSPTVSTEPTEAATPTKAATPKATATEDTAVKAQGVAQGVTTADLVVTLNCTSAPEQITVTNNGAVSVVIRTIGSIYRPVSWEPVTVQKSLGAGKSYTWLAGPTATGANALTNQLFLTNNVWEQEGVVIVTSVGTIRQQCAPEPPVTTADIKVTINCVSATETISVTNNATRAVTIISIGSTYRTVTWEPVVVNKSLGAGKTQTWKTGPSATGSNVLTDRLIFTNTAWEKEGVAVNTSVGTVKVQCAPAPPVTKDQIAVTINCTSDPEKIRVTNNGYRQIEVKSIGTIYNPTSQEPFTLNYKINPSKTQIWYAGEGGTGNRVLTRNYILTNSAYDREGVKVVTSAGTITVKCPEAPPDPFGGAKWIEINLSTQYLIAWQNGVRVNETYVSTGRPGFDTPTGTWYVNTKYYTDDMQGCIQGECYFVPDVPWTMYFTNWGHALHGAYWHNNFGNVMSHGCVNLPVPFAEWLFYWTPIGTPVVIHY